MFDLKKHIHLSEEIKPYSGPIKRYNLTLNKAEAAELNGIAQALGMAQQCIIREALRMFETAYHIEPEHFIAEVKRCRARQLEAVTLDYLEAQRKLEAAKELTEQEQLPADYIHDCEVIESAEKCAEKYEKIDVLSAYRKSQE